MRIATEYQVIGYGLLNQERRRGRMLSLDYVNAADFGAKPGTGSDRVLPEA